MRKQVQKERCTKIMLTKCKAVCHLYDKVQLAAAKMLDAEPAIFQFECNVPILCNDIPANDLNLPSETYTTDFVLHYDYTGGLFHKCFYFRVGTWPRHIDSPASLIGDEIKGIALRVAIEIALRIYGIHIISSK